MAGMLESVGFFQLAGTFLKAEFKEFAFRGYNLLFKLLIG
jgi:hypothetical protein